MAECLTQRRRAAEVAKVRLGEVCDLFVDGDWIESKDQSPEGYRLVQTGNVGIGEYLDKKERAKFISADTFERLKCTEIFAGDVLVSRLPDPVGRACILPDLKQRAITAVDCSIIRFNSLSCEAGYFVHFTRSQDYARQISQFLAGSTRVRISRRNLQTVEIPLPSLADQKQIAAKLDAICEIVSKREEQLKKLDQLVKSRFVEMFGDELGTSWQTATVGDVALVSVGVVIRPTQYYAESGIRAFRSLNIGEMCVKDTDWVYFTEEGHELCRKSRVQAGDVLVVRSGAPGTACVVPADFGEANAVDVIIARPDSAMVDPVYLAMFTNMPHGMNQIRNRTGGAAQQHFNVGGYKAMRLMLPPLALQREFAAFVAEVDKSKFAVRKSLESYQKLYRQQLQEAFG